MIIYLSFMANKYVAKRITQSPDSISRALKLIERYMPVVHQDENFVVSALFCAAEEGNIAGIKELFSMAKIDPNVSNKVRSSCPQRGTYHGLCGNHVFFSRSVFVSGELEGLLVHSTLDADCIAKDYPNHQLSNSYHLQI